MKLKEEFITQNFRGEQLMIAVGKEAKHFLGIARANETASFIIERLRSETDEDAIVKAILETYEVDGTTARVDVHRTVEQLRGIGAIEE